jgi:hydrogenase maturation factor
VTIPSRGGERFGAGKLPHGVLEKLIESYTHDDTRLVVPPGVGEDAAVIDFGDRYLVAKTDPITFATDAIGWYAVNVNANDIAAMGAEPRFFMATIIIPEQQATASLIESIFASIHEAASELGVTVCGGHTEITHGIDRPIVVGQMLGECSRDRLVRSSGLEQGDRILLTKGLAIEATSIIAREKREDLLTRGFEASFLERCAGYLHNPGISIVRDARLAQDAGTPIHAMHDPTEGGVATGLFELATASGVGLEVDADALYVSAESSRLCAEYDLDPFGIISSGALLIGCSAAGVETVIEAIRQGGIEVEEIAVVRPRDFGLQLRRGSALEPLPHFEVDELTKLWSS